MKTLSPKQKELLKEFFNWKCEICHIKKDSKELEIHRIKRGNSFGSYDLRNVLVQCKTCHDKMHYHEVFR